MKSHKENCSINRGFLCNCGGRHETAKGRYTMKPTPTPAGKEDAGEGDLRQEIAGLRKDILVLASAVAELLKRSAPERPAAPTGWIETPRAEGGSRIDHIEF